MLDKCAKCGAPARIRHGYYGRYAECSRHPEHNASDFCKTALLVESDWNGKQKRIAEMREKHENAIGGSE